MFDAAEEFEGIFAGQKCVRGVVVDAEVGGVNSRDEVAEDVHLLGEFGVVPVVVFVVVLDDQLDAALGGVGDAGLDGFGGVADAVFAGDFGAALAGEDAAEICA